MHYRSNGSSSARLKQLNHRGDKSRTTEAGESGLGLAITKALVEAHHGEVCSRPGDGH